MKVALLDNVSHFQGEMVIHSENNSPFLTVTDMHRLVEVSHWGNIAVEETFDVRHSGAKLKGSFSRFDYQRHQDGAASIKTFKVMWYIFLLKVFSLVFVLIECFH